MGHAAMTLHHRTGSTAIISYPVADESLARTVAR